MLIAKDITKSYPTPRGTLAILNGISLTLNRGDAVAITGPSGSGKSTLLYILGALEPPSSGTITLDGSNPYELGERAQAAFRNQHIGFVGFNGFQQPLEKGKALADEISTLIAAPPGCAVKINRDSAAFMLGNFAGNMQHRQDVGTQAGAFIARAEPGNLIIGMQIHF